MKRKLLLWIINWLLYSLYKDRIGIEDNRLGRRFWPTVHYHYDDDEAAGDVEVHVEVHTETHGLAVYLPEVSKIGAVAFVDLFRPSLTHLGAIYLFDPRKDDEPISACAYRPNSFVVSIENGDDPDKDESGG